MPLSRRARSSSLCILQTRPRTGPVSAPLLHRVGARAQRGRRAHLRPATSHTLIFPPSPPPDHAFEDRHPDKVGEQGSRLEDLMAQCARRGINYCFVAVNGTESQFVRARARSEAAPHVLTLSPRLTPPNAA